MSRLSRLAIERASWLADDITHEQQVPDRVDVPGSDMLLGLAAELEEKNGDPLLVKAARQRAGWLRTRTPLEFYDQQKVKTTEKFPLAGDCYSGPNILWKLAEALR